MSENLPAGAFTISSGKLGQLIFENPGANISPRLEFFIEINFSAFDYDGDTLRPVLRLNNILLDGVTSWQPLANVKAEFPYSPKPGSIDAGVHLFRFQNPADVTTLQFGQIETGKISVQFDTEVDFEIEGDSEWEQVPLSIECPLEITPLRVATSLEKRFKSDVSAITESVAGLVDLDAYFALEKVAGGFEFPPKT